MSVGKIGPFEIYKDNWDLYIERLGQYFIVNDVKEAVKVATLITVIGSEAYELMVNLCTPDRPATKSYDDLVAVMKAHLQPKPSLLAERYKFRQRRQAAHEGIAEYAAALKKLSMTCSFRAGSELKDNLRDQFVCGLAKDDVRQRLFAEDGITFEMAFKLAVTMETAVASAAAVDTREGRRGGAAELYQMTPSRGDRSGTSSGSRPKVSEEVLGVRGATGGSYAGGGSARAAKWKPNGASNVGGGRGGGAQQVATGGCAACGGQHTARSCKFRVYVCRVCNREGHLKKVCPRLRSGQLFGVYEVAQGDHVAGGDSEGSDEVYIDNFSLVDNLSRYPPYLVKIKINDIELMMEIDTGSSISCISFDCYRKYFTNCKLHKNNLTLCYYTGEMTRPVGKIRPTVRYKDHMKKLDLYVIENGKTNLLGRQWLKELDFQLPLNVAACNSLDSKEKLFNLDDFSSRFKAVFEDGLGRFTGGLVGFRLRADARPVFLRARPLAYALRGPVERALDDLVRDGVLTPVCTSDWATPIVPVLKKDGTIRVCGDFKLTLNKCLEVDRFPLPRVEDLLTKLHGGQRFTKLDLSQAYAQFELDESKQYAVINTHKGLFRYERLIYGLASSPGIFQRKLEQLFADMPRVGVFLDDVIITGCDDTEHLDTLTQVFERLQKYGLKIKKQKCTFFADSVTYLGFVISKEGVHTCPEKLEAIEKVPVPSNVSELRSFLGLVMYYAKFVPNISTLLSPLYNLLKKEVKFNWNESCDRAFNEVKRLLVSSEVLAHYSGELPLILTTDASSVGVGAVISHMVPAEGARGQEAAAHERPVAYASRSLNQAERGYSQIEREALSIIFGIRKFHQYLFGRKFILRTDHKPLVTIFGDKAGIPVMAASRMQRWAVLLAGYDYDIEYVRSEKNAADALSRLPAGREASVCKELTYINFVQSFLPITRKVIKEYTFKDDALQKVVLYLQSGWPNHQIDEQMKPYLNRKWELYLDMGCVVWGYRLVIPSALRDAVLKELHTGHMGMVKMKSIARSYVWWPGIDADIESTCRECATCTAEGSAPARATPRPWPYVTEPWTRLHVDFLGPFQGRTFLVLIDASTKWLEAFALQRTTAGSVIKVLTETFARFGLPKEVVSDNGPPFSSREYNDFMMSNGIKTTFSPVYHPSSNGAAEGGVKLCKRAIKKALRDGDDVDTALQSYLMTYRNVEHSTTGTSPAMLLQRRNLRTRLDLLKGDREVENRVREAQRRQVQYAGGKDRNLGVGSRVWTRNYGQGEKWLSGKVEERVGSRNYIISRENCPPLKRHIDQIRGRWQSALELPCPGGTSSQVDMREVPVVSAGSEPGPLAPVGAPVGRPTLRPRPVRPPERYGYV